MPATLLFVTQVAPYDRGPAGVHGVLGQATAAMAQLAEQAGLHFVHCDDVRTLSSWELETARVLGLFTIGETPWSAQQRDAVLSQLRAGRLGVLGMHSAADASYGWPEYIEVVGARFNGHPWTTTMEVEVVDDEHPATAPWPSRFSWHDEVYQFKHLRRDAQVLLRIDPTQLDPAAKGIAVPDFGMPMSWCFKPAGGRAFYTALGHFPAAYENAEYLRHLAGGLAWILHDS